MALDESHLRDILNGFTGGELEFLCEDEMVRITPSLEHDAIGLLGTVQPVGPLIPGYPVEVPLWMAISLKKQHKATIIPPDWMQIDSLTKWRDGEKENDAFMRPPVDAYVELSRILLHYARDDMENGTGVPSKDIEALLGDIQDVRQAKIRNGLNQISHQVSHIRLNNIGTMELNTIRTLYSTALADFRRLNRAKESSELGSSQPTSSQQSGGGVSMPAPMQIADSQRRSLRGGLPQPPSAASQLGPATQAAQEGLEQARKIRRTG